jgi:hypothetical protein
MTLDNKAFEYLKPTDAQVDDMAVVRQAFASVAQALDAMLPDGPDKTHTLRILRTAAMWANVAITRQPDGTPRTDQS